uniref:Odorant receptor n=1 Tax=Conogethes pinicolalis TaxID=1178461 RepID=A0A5B9GCL5_9NEOP|nr:odorant receptor 38 [Conogethes pinicolalis]
MLRTYSSANNGTRYYYKLCNIVYLAGLPNFWMEDLGYSETFVKYFDYLTKLVTGILYMFMVSEWAAAFTQHNLTPKQSSDSLLFNYAHPLLSTYRLIMIYKQDQFRELIFNLFVKLKEVFNEEKVEQEMIRKSKMFVVSFTIICSMTLVFYGFESFLQVLTTDATFTTVITAWPDVKDKSTAAGVGRVIAYLIWWMLMLRIFASYIIVMSLMVALEYQYKNLRQYFRSLQEIFEEDLSQSEMEMKYEEGVKIGIRLHSETLNCARLAQDTCSTIYCLQIILNITVLVSLMSQMLDSGRTVNTVFTIVVTAVGTLLSTGVFMWTAGDVTVEAALLATDMYDSGWQNCYERVVSVRKLLTVAMAQAQRPVNIKGLGILEISYSAYLQIVKSSYSLFTMLY